MKNTTIKKRLTEVQDKISLLEEENKQAREAAKAAGAKCQGSDLPHAPSVIYKLGRDFDALTLLQYADIESRIKNESDERVKKSMQAKLARFTDPAVSAGVTCKAGDLITTLLVTYKDTKDVAAKLQAFCDKNNLVFNLDQNKITSK